jgi:integrase
MRGHIAKKGNRYYVVVDEPTEDGRRRRRWHGSWTTKKEAGTALTAILGKIDSGSYVPPSAATLGGFLVDEWLPAMRTRLRPSTIGSYETIVGAYVVPRIGDVKLQRLTPARLNVFYAGLLDDGAKRGGGLSPTSTRNVHRVLHRALADAVRWDRLPKNPADFADPPRTGRGEMVTWTAAELRAFLAHSDGDDLAALWRLLASTGLRRGEALGLRWADIDLDGGHIAVQRALSYVGAEAVLGDVKTSRSRRRVTIPTKTVVSLRAHRARQLETRLLVGPGYRDDLDLVFAAPDGSPLRPATVSRRFARLVTEAELPTLTLHGLRHSWATLALSAGVPLKVASEVLGHASTTITADTYQHVTPAMVEDATERVAALIAGPVEVR